MPRSPAQSDFRFVSPSLVELPPAAWPVSLPPVPMPEASAGTTRWMLRATLLLLLVLVALVGIGLHIPSGG